MTGVGVFDGSKSIRHRAPDLAQSSRIHNSKYGVLEVVFHNNAAELPAGCPPAKSDRLRPRDGVGRAGVEGAAAKPHRPHQERR